MNRDLILMSTEELLTLYIALGSLNDGNIGDDPPSAPIDQTLVDIETILIERGAVDRLVKGD
jgi:hypothetical protein